MHSGQIELDTMQQQGIFGAYDANIRSVEKAFDVAITARDGKVDVKGKTEGDVTMAVQTLETLKKMYAQGERIDDLAIVRAIDLVNNGDVDGVLNAIDGVVVITHNGKPIKCKTMGQKRYIEAMQKNTVTFCIGPAGTGKTYLAVAAAVAAFRRNQFERIIMCRPAIEAGEERLGFLPGDLQSKVDPYLRPLYDALDEILGPETVQKCMEKRTIEIAPLAYMRGRTLNGALVIVDESQNMGLSTIKMILTRLGEGSKMVLTGDVTQIDLPKGTESGLERSAELLSGIDDIAVVRLYNRDVVRHKLVREIVKAFEKNEERIKKNSKNTAALKGYHKKK